MNEPEIRTAEVVALVDGLRRLTAPNPSPMTGPGTNSYIVGHGPYVIVDPGVDDSAHLDALVAACDGQVAMICLTHRHPDHVGGASVLAARTGAPVCAWPKPVLAHHDRPVHIDRSLTDGEQIDAGGVAMVVHHTPGHAADHVAFELPGPGILLAGDTLMSDATVVILPPDGDMHDYFNTLDRLAALDLHAIAPAHGRILDAPARAIAAVVAHRREREAQVAAALSRHTARRAETIADALYPQLYDHLKTMAVLQVRAHLMHLAVQGRAEETGGGWRATAD